MLRYLFLILLVVSTSCTSSESVTNTSTKNKEGPGSFLTGRSEQGISLSDITGEEKNKSFGIPVNAFLESLIGYCSILPIDDIDVFSGTILTDWYSLPSNQNEQIKLAIFVLDKELRSDAIRVIVYVETRNGGIWEDGGIDNLLARNIEDLILTRARELRASSINQ
ncbi:MAG: hypothetical protein CM15mP117_10400 [Alphaproteobacteria bacterium]|nr:MAG: hypothetical protein CM15mP117_10400 [Alphaproteobacteria bacterium]